MNRSNVANKLRAAKDAASVRLAPLAVGATALTMSGGAFAQSGGFDESSVIAKITEYGATGVAIVGTFILALWGLKSMGLLKRG